MLDEEEDIMEVLAMLQAEEDGEDMEAWKAKRAKQLKEEENKRMLPFVSSLFFEDEDEDVKLRDMLELQETLAELQEEYF